MEYAPSNNTPLLTPAAETGGAVETNGAGGGGTPGADDTLVGTHHTYVAGEDASRLASAAKFLGLAKSRAPLKPPPSHSFSYATIRAAFEMDGALPAAMMHSVGALGEDERVDDRGRISVGRKARRRCTVGGEFGREECGTLRGMSRDRDGGRTAFSFVIGGSAAEEEEGEVEDEVEEIVEGGSIEAAVFGIIKGTVGPAVLYLPRGFEKSGWVIAAPAVLFATLTFVFSSYRLLECWSVESERDNSKRDDETRALLTANGAENAGGAEANGRGGGYGAAGRAEGGGGREGTAAVSRASSLSGGGLLTYPALARRALGRWAVLVELGIALMQFGVCLTYLIFVPQNLRECVATLTGRRVSKIWFLVGMVAFELPMSLVKDIRKLTPLNVTATLLIAYGLLSVLAIAVVQGLGTVEALEDDAYSLDGEGGITADGGDGKMKGVGEGGRFVFQENLASLPALTNAWFLFVGTSFFMMEGSMTLVVPLQGAVHRAEDRAKFPRINARTTWCIAGFYLAFAFVCCAAFGKGMKTALTASLPEGAFSASVQLAYSVAVVFTFPLQAFPAQEVTRRAFLGGGGEDDGGKERGGNVGRNALSVSLTLLLGLIAVLAIDYLGNVVSVLGSLFGIPLALVFPPLMHNALVQDAGPRARRINFAVVGVGFFAMGAASYATFVNWDKGAEGS